MEDKNVVWVTLAVVVSVGIILWLVFGSAHEPQQTEPVPAPPAAEEPAPAPAPEPAPVPVPEPAPVPDEPKPEQLPVVPEVDEPEVAPPDEPSPDEENGDHQPLPPAATQLPAEPEKEEGP